MYILYQIICFHIYAIYSYIYIHIFIFSFIVYIYIIYRVFYVILVICVQYTVDWQAATMVAPKVLEQMLGAYDAREPWYLGVRRGVETRKTKIDWDKHEETDIETCSSSCVSCLYRYICIYIWTTWNLCSKWVEWYSDVRLILDR